MKTRNVSNGTLGFGATGAGTCFPVASTVKGVKVGAPVTAFLCDLNVTTLLPAAVCIAVEMGLYLTTASKQPARMILLRPILSESAPKTVKNGIAKSIATA